MIGGNGFIGHGIRTYTYIQYNFCASSLEWEGQGEGNIGI